MSDFHLNDRVIIFDNNNKPFSADKIMGIDSNGILLVRSNARWNLDGTEKTVVSEPKHFEKVVFTDEYTLYRELMRKYILRFDYDALDLEHLEEIYGNML